jgi:hypothetical protein
MHCLFKFQEFQALAIETFHDNSLSRFLLERALRNRLYVGQALFWQLRVRSLSICCLHSIISIDDFVFVFLIKTEAQSERFEKYNVLLQTYLELCGGQKEELISQLNVIHKLEQTALCIHSLVLCCFDFMQDVTCY